MRRIVGIGSDTVTVQPGVVLGQLNRYLAGFGRQFGPTRHGRRDDDGQRGSPSKFRQQLAAATACALNTW